MGNKILGKNNVFWEKILQTDSGRKEKMATKRSEKTDSFYILLDCL